MSEPSSHHAHSPAKGRGRGRGGRGGQASSRAAAAIAAKAGVRKTAANVRRGGRHAAVSKLVVTDSSSRAQAAEDRAKELKTAFATVAAAIRPALEDLADRNVDLLRERPHAHEKVPEFSPVRSFLDQRLSEVLRNADALLEADMALSQKKFDLQKNLTQQEFHRQFEEATNDFLDAQIRRLDILEHLHDHRLPVDLAEDDFLFRHVTEERFRWTKFHVETENGVEVPCAKSIQAPHILEIERSRVQQLASAMAVRSSPSKRKVIESELLLLGQPALKRPATAIEDGRPTYIPRHIGGLLSATNPDEDEALSQAPSQAASPSGSKLPSPSPESGAKGSADGAVSSYVPQAASDADEHGVRFISKRRPATVENFNRLMVPSLYEYEDHEIGFRDSFNDKAKNKTHRHQQHWNKPNSFAFFFDRMVNGVDVGTYEPGDLDEDLVEKHDLHRRFGFFLRNSKNEEEPPRQRVSGHHPVVFVAPSGKTMHSSRSLGLIRLDGYSKDREGRAVLTAALGAFCDREGLDRAELKPSAVDVEEHRRALLKDRVMSDEDEDATLTEAADDDATRDEKLDEEAVADPGLQFLLLLEAANTAADVEARATADAQTRRTPFDPIRDVFDEALLPPPESLPQPLPRISPEDMIRVSILADAASEAPRLLKRGGSPVPVTAPGIFHHSLLNPPPLLPQSPPKEYTKEYYDYRPASLPPGTRHPVADVPPPTLPPGHPVSQPPPDSTVLLDPRLFGEPGSVVQRGGVAGSQPAPPQQNNNRFLQTALNPSSDYGTTPFDALAYASGHKHHEGRHGEPSHFGVQDSQHWRRSQDSAQQHCLQPQPHQHHQLLLDAPIGSPGPGSRPSSSRPSSTRPSPSGRSSSHPLDDGFRDRLPFSNPASGSRVNLPGLPSLRPATRGASLQLMEVHEPATAAENNRAPSVQPLNHPHHPRRNMSAEARGAADSHSPSPVVPHIQPRLSPTQEPSHLQQRQQQPPPNRPRYSAEDMKFFRYREPILPNERPLQPQPSPPPPQTQTQQSKETAYIPKYGEPYYNHQPTSPPPPPQHRPPLQPNPRFSAEDMKFRYCEPILPYDHPSQPQPAPAPHQQQQHSQQDTNRVGFGEPFKLYERPFSPPPPQQQQQQRLAMMSIEGEVQNRPGDDHEAPQHPRGYPTRERFDLQSPQQMHSQPRGNTPFLAPPGMHPPPPPLQSYPQKSHLHQPFSPPPPPTHQGQQHPFPYPGQPLPLQPYGPPALAPQQPFGPAPSPTDAAPQPSLTGPVIGGGQSPPPPFASAVPHGRRESISGPVDPKQQQQYRKLEPAPTPPHRRGLSNNGPELRTVQYDFREIKDYIPSAAPPSSGPTHIRGWAYQNPTARTSRGTVASSNSPAAAAASSPVTVAPSGGQEHRT